MSESNYAIGGAGVLMSVAGCIITMASNFSIALGLFMIWLVYYCLMGLGVGKGVKMAAQSSILLLAVLVMMIITGCVIVLVNSWQIAVGLFLIWLGRFCLKMVGEEVKNEV